MLVACSNCSAPLLGFSKTYTDFSFTADNFCKRCGKPYLWADQEAIIHSLENTLLYGDELDDAEKREILERLMVLAATDKTDKARVAAGERIKQLAPKAWNVAAPVLMSILSAEIKLKLGLPLA